MHRNDWALLPLAVRALVSACLICLLAVVLAGCGGGSGSSQNVGGGGTSTGGETNKGNGVAVVGQLTRADKAGQPLAGASVTLTPTRAASRAAIATRTDSNGNYNLDAVPAGQYTLSAESADGSYQKAQLPVMVLQQKTTVPPLGLIPAGVAIGNIEFVLPARDGPNNTYVIGGNYTFSARVTDTSGRTLDGWRPNWAIGGGIGTITPAGVFTATSAGAGEVQAFFYVGAQQVVFKASLTTSDGIGPEPNVLTGVRFTGVDYGYSVYGARSGRKVGERGGVTKEAIRLAQAPDGSVFALGYHSKTLVKLDANLNPVAGFVGQNLPSQAEKLIVLPSGNVAVLSTLNSVSGFHLFDPNTGNYLSRQPFGSEQDIDTVYDVKQGPDGDLYVSGADNGRGVIVRFHIGANDTIQRVGTPVLLNVTTKPFRGIAFAQNGNILAVRADTKQLEVYTTNGDRVGGFALPASFGGRTVSDLGAIALVRGSLDANGDGAITNADEVVYLRTNYGVIRLKYQGGAKFEVIQEASSQYFVNSTVIEDLLALK